MRLSVGPPHHQIMIIRKIMTCSSDELRQRSSPTLYGMLPKEIENVIMDYKTGFEQRQAQVEKAKKLIKIYQERVTKYTIKLESREKFFEEHPILLNFNTLTSLMKIIEFYEAKIEQLRNEFEIGIDINQFPAVFDQLGL